MAGIVVGLDGSEASGRALGRAAEEARLTGQPVRAVNAWTTPVWLDGIPGFPYNAVPSADELGAFSRELLERQLKELRETSDVDQVSITTEAVEGTARHVLLTVSQSADLLVLGSHGHGQVAGLLLGSVATHVLNHAACPVMLVPGEGSVTGQVGRVVVGADGSESSRAAMRWALGSARLHGCPLVVLHAWQLATVPGLQSVQYVESLRDCETRCQAWLDAEVEAILPDPGGVDVRRELCYSTPTWGLREAVGPTDQLVVGRCGRGGFTGLLLGSVASQCAHYAQGVVVVVPEHD